MFYSIIETAMSISAEEETSAYPNFLVCKAPWESKHWIVHTAASADVEAILGLTKAAGKNRRVLNFRLWKDARRGHGDCVASKRDSSRSQRQRHLAAPSPTNSHLQLCTVASLSVQTFHAVCQTQWCQPSADIICGRPSSYAHSRTSLFNPNTNPNLRPFVLEISKPVTRATRNVHNQFRLFYAFLRATACNALRLLAIIIVCLSVHPSACHTLKYY